MISLKDQDNNYAARIVRVNTIHPIEGANTIATAIVEYQPVIVSNETKPGTLFVFFPAGGQIMPKLLSGANLYDKGSADLNADPEQSGYFSKTGRVRTAKFMSGKAQSVGFLLPAITVERVYGISDLASHEGEVFDSINGELMVQKYVPKESSGGKTKGPSRTQKQPKRLSRLVDGQFYPHVKTSNLRRTVGEIDTDDIITISYKIHGTSWIVANVLVKRAPTLIERIAKFFGANIQETEYDHLAASRRVIRNGYLEDPNAKKEGFYEWDIWTDIKDRIKDQVPKGYTVYGEAFGFTPTGKPIQSMNGFAYDYGQGPFQYDITVYRVTYTNPDGIVTDLRHSDLVDFCEKYHFEMADEFYHGSVRGWLHMNGIDYRDMDWRGKFISRLEALYNEKDCYLCMNKVPEEGIVIRVENRASWTGQKLKSMRFLHEEDASGEDKNIEE